MIVDDDETSFGKYNACKETDELVRRLKKENKVLLKLLDESTERIIKLEKEICILLTKVR